MAPLTDLEVLAFVQEVLVAGNETTRNTLIGGLARLIRHPDQLRCCGIIPELTGNAIDEILRLETPASAMWRIATRDTTLGGVHLPTGAVLSLRYDSANRDESQFPNADAFDVRRTNARTHLAFSYGTHHCMGQNLARKELAIALPRIVSRLQNLKIVAERSDLSYRPNVMIRAMRGLYIAFDPAPRVKQDRQPRRTLHERPTVPACRNGSRLHVPDWVRRVNEEGGASISGAWFPWMRSP